MLVCSEVRKTNRLQQDLKILNRRLKDTNFHSGRDSDTEDQEMALCEQPPESYCKMRQELEIKREH